MVSGKETVTRMILGIVWVAVFCNMTLNLLLRKEGEVITDSCLKIGGKLYHINVRVWTIRLWRSAW